MFTGIITHVGKISKKQIGKLTISNNSSFLSKIKRGMSIAVNGICLTLVSKSKSSFSIDFIPETENKTTLKYLKKGSLVNLELPATPSSFLSGHILLGHIDTTTMLASIEEEKNSKILKFKISPSLSKYIVSKGPIALNGISLTIIEAGSDYLTVGIIPYTWNKTMLHSLKLGDFVNIEADILAKYLERLINK